MYVIFSVYYLPEASYTTSEFLLQHDGYQYHQDAPGDVKKIMRWRCDREDSGCKSVVITVDGVLTFTKNEHNHRTKRARIGIQDYKESLSLKNCACICAVKDYNLKSH